MIFARESAQAGQNLFEYCYYKNYTCMKIIRIFTTISKYLLTLQLYEKTSHNFDFVSLCILCDVRETAGARFAFPETGRVDR